MKNRATPDIPPIDDRPTDEGTPVRLTEMLRHRLARLALRRTALGREMRRFGAWVELDAARIAEEEQQAAILVELGSGGAVEALRIGPRKHEHDLDQFARLWNFLVSLGVRFVQLDARLEGNQVEDILTLLYAYRGQLARRGSGSIRTRIAAELAGPNGLHFACAETSLRRDTLTIAYSYCTLLFSGIIRWFEKRHRQFHDHRTLYHAAPRYSLTIGIVTSIPGFILAYVHSSIAVLAVTVAGAFTFIGILYFFMMAVGSVEYDYEEQAYRLSMAYGKLKTFTGHMQEDIERARVIQSRFLPDLERLPLPEETAWAAGYLPAGRVGGDYFDVHALAGGRRVVILFSDVSGHGMAAAFITAILKTSFQAWVDHPTTLEGLVRQLNSALSRLTPLSNYAAVFAALYDVRERTLEYANCGHNPEPWRIPGPCGEPITSLSEARNLLLGIKEEIDIQTARRALSPGDTVLFVSDGIVENEDVDGEVYGTERFEELMKAGRGRGLSLQALADSILEEAGRFSQGAPQSDDRTVLAFQIVSSPSSPSP
jgi:serine phosphatase RsbU (regulator of sigma subunit)